MRQGVTEGQVRKHQSDVIMDATWNGDIQAKKCFIYDYFHDDQRNLGKGMRYGCGTTKTPIDCKFIVTQYSSLAKDQVEYHIQFRPSERFNRIPGLKKHQEKFQTEDVIGYYIDIPDDKGVYQKWLICSKEIGNQFIKYSVLPCNYYFHWVTDGKKYDMWGCTRVRSSYGTGVWQAYVALEFENQDQMWLPMNDISSLLYYDQRIVVSAQILERPLIWKITKLENMHPFGINKLTLSQTAFDPDTDKRVDGWWYADYAPLGIEPTPEPSKPVPGLTISYIGTNPNIKIGGAPKKYIADFGVGNISWEFEVDGQNVLKRLQVTYDAEGCFVTTDDEYLVGKIMTVRAIQADGQMAEMNVGFSYL